MIKYIVQGGTKLSGSVTISGAKNAAGAILPATLLVSGPCRIENVPDISDVRLLLEILRDMGAEIRRYGRNTLEIDCTRARNATAPIELVRRIRASYYLIGAELGRFGHAHVAMPGGCNFGVRPIDQHIKGFEAMGAMVEQSGGYVCADAPKGGLRGGHIYLDIVSVGATMNIMIAGVLANGTTVIENAAKEPEISNLIDLLNLMGAKIEGRDTSILTIEGVKELHGAELPVVSDRIEAGSYAIAAAITHGRIELVNARSEHLQQPLRVLEKMGVGVEEKEHSIIIDGIGKTIVGEDIYTDYYPGFPTDLQAQFMALMTVANGASLVTESIWENRFMHVPELCRMGANINIHGHASAIVRGVEKLSGAPVMATDLRASFALILAGVAAEGETIVNRVYHLDRGYEKLEEKLKSVGAEIERIKETD